MTPSQHYKEAERLLEESKRIGSNNPTKAGAETLHAGLMSIVAMAQVHATLATAQPWQAGWEQSP